MGVNEGATGTTTPTSRIWSGGRECKLSPQIFKKIPLSIHQNTPFQAKNLRFFFLGSPQWTSFLAPTKSSGSATAYSAEFQPDFRPWKTRGVLASATAWPHCGLYYYY